MRDILLVTLTVAVLWMHVSVDWQLQVNGTVIPIGLYDTYEDCMTAWSHLDDRIDCKLILRRAH